MPKHTNLLVIFSYFLFSCQSPKSNDALNAQITLNPQDRPNPIPAQPGGSLLESPQMSEDLKEVQSSLIFLLAEQASYRGQQKIAHELYRRSYDLTPGSYLAAKVMLTDAEGAAPEGVFGEKMVLTYPKDKTLRLIWAQQLFKRGELDNALKEGKKILGDDPKDFGAHSLLVQIYSAKNALDLACLQAQKMTKIFSDNALAFSMLAQIYIQLKDYKKALGPARKAYELQGENEEFILVYAYMLELNADSASAVKIYNQLFKRAPKSEDFLVRTAILYRVFGRLENVLERLNQMVQKPLGNLVNLHLQRVFILWELKRDQEALTILADLTRSHPDSVLVRYMQGLGYERVADATQAYAAYDQVASESEYYFFARYRMINILQNMKKTREALDLALDLLKNRYANWETYVVVASLHADLDDPKEAISLLSDAVIKYPTKTQLLFLRGVYEERSRDIDACIHTMREVIAKDPGFSSAYNYLGYIYAQRGDNLDEAASLIAKAIELKPNDGYYIDSLGWVYYQKGLYKEATSLFLEAIKFAPDEGVIYDHLGDSLIKMNEAVNARKAYEKALELKLEESDRHAIEQKLQTLDESP